MNLEQIVKVASILIKNISPDDAKRAMAYLNKFNGLDNPNVDSVRDRIKDAQGILQLTPTGTLDERTFKAMMNTPRCGCSDYQFARNVINKWGKNEITYYIDRYVDGIAPQEQNEIFAEAFQAWERHCLLRCYPVNDRNADIVISASSSRKEEFGTVGNVLAWAYLPQGNNWNGQLITKFDLAESWLARGKKGRGVRLLTVAKHEWGHLWGLDHTNILGQMMYPTYAEDVEELQPEYDIPEIQKRHGIKEPTDDVPQHPTVDNIRVLVNNKQYKLCSVD